MKNKGFMMIEILICLSILTICTSLCYNTVQASINANEIIEERLEEIQDNEMNIIDLLENGCGLECITTLEAY